MPAEPARLVTDETSLNIPHSIDAEQSLLGMLLLNNKLFDELEGWITPAHFHARFHSQLFETIQMIISKGHEANPISVVENLQDRSSFGDKKELTSNLTTLLENASLSYNVRTFANIIHDFYLLRELMTVGSELTSGAVKETNTDIAQDLLEEGERRLFELAEFGSAKAQAQNLRNPLKAVIDRAHEAKKSGSALTGTTTGFKDLDEKLGGFQKSDLIILAARPSMGKTALAINMAFNAANAAAQEQHGGANVGVFSLEMSADQLAARILANASGLDSSKIDKGRLNNQEFDQLAAVAGELAEVGMVIDDTPALSINAVRSRARRMKRQHNIGMIIIDYLQLMRGSASNRDNRVQEISEISQGLKAIARELDVPVIALSQLSRAVESRDNKRPQLSDLRESGSIEQDADIVMFLYREEYYKEREFGPQNQWDEEKKALIQQIKGVSEVLISKNRKGATGGITLQFTPETTSFHDHADTKGYENSLQDSPF